MKITDYLCECFGQEIRCIHELKSHPAEFEALRARAKLHEVRRFDRDFQHGDWLLLREWDPAGEQYTGRELLREIMHITPPGSLGLPDDIGVLSVF